VLIFILVSIDIKSLSVKEKLNDDIWTKDKKLKPEIRERLLTLAEDFYKELDIPWAELEDIRFTGSLANYNWSKYSDVDLHLVIDYTLVDENVDLVEEYFKARKSLWNDYHDITIHGFDVEIYVEDAQGEHFSSGVYSVLMDEWVIEPKPQSPNIDKLAIKNKAKVIMRLIDDLVVDKLKEGDYDGAIKAAELMSEKIKKMRQGGLESGGEYSVENLTFKILRRNGTLDKLYATKLDAYDKMMSIE